MVAAKLFCTMWKCGLTTLHIFQNHGTLWHSNSLPGFKQIIGKRQTAHTVNSKLFTWHFMPWSGGRDSLQSKMTLPKAPAQKGRMSSSVLWKSDKTSSWWQMPLEAKSAKPTEGDRPSQVSEPKEAGWLTTVRNLEWDSITTTTKKKPARQKHKKIWTKYKF